MDGRVSVETKVLLENAKQKKLDTIKQHEKDVKKYERDVIKYRNVVASALYRARIKIKTGKSLPETTSRYNRVPKQAVEIPVSMVKPQKPKLNVYSIERDIRFLEAQKKLIMQVGPNDYYAVYVGDNNEIN